MRGRGITETSRSAATELVKRPTTTPSSPLAAPNASRPPVVSHSLLLTSGSSPPSACPVSGTVHRRTASRRSTATPHAVPTTVGTMSGRVAPGRESTAAQPRSPATTKITLPTGRRRVS